MRASRAGLSPWACPCKKEQGHLCEELSKDRLRPVQVQLFAGGRAAFAPRSHCGAPASRPLRARADLFFLRFWVVFFQSFCSFFSFFFIMRFSLTRQRKSAEKKAGENTAEITPEKQIPSAFPTVLRTVGKASDDLHFLNFCCFLCES